MKTLYIDQKMKYDGTQLRPLFAYLDHKLQGDSVVAWQGPCDISFAHMIDGEDLLQQAAIRGSNMLHFIFEIFDRELVSGIFLQRLFASILSDEIYQMTKIKLQREGDDLYWEGKKLSISIASRSGVSVMVHFAVNISNEGTPVPTCSLEDFKIEAKSFAQILLKKISSEYDSIMTARVKVRPL